MTESNQSQKTHRNEIVVNYRSEEFLGMDLQNREKTERELVNILRRYFVEEAATKMTRPLIGCVGMPGIGKTRMLHEFMRILNHYFPPDKPLSKIKGVYQERIEVLVTYSNASGFIKNFDSK